MYNLASMDREMLSCAGETGMPDHGLHGKVVWVKAAVLPPLINSVHIFGVPAVMPGSLLAEEVELKQ